MTDGDGEISAEDPGLISGENKQITSPEYVDGSQDNSERQSRRLYVITEESHSNIGPTISMEDYAKASFKN